jgi:two-component system, cell cycle sensor histidine kinase and response regulator CckA
VQTPSAAGALDPSHAQRALLLTQSLVSANAGAESAADALATTTEVLGRTGDWSAAHAWTRDADGERLSLAYGWYADPDGIEPLRRATESLTLSPGEGLPGQAWSRAAPVWLADLDTQADLPRRRLMRRLGLRTVVAVPILSGHDEVVAVIELLAHEERAEDRALVEIASTVGAHLGSLLQARSSEEEARASEEKFRSVAESAADSIVSADRQGRIMYVNRAAEESFGFAAATAVGTDFDSLFASPAQAAQLRESLARGEGDGRYRGVRLTCRAFDGREFPAEVSIAWAPFAGGCVHAIVSDISSWLEAETRLQRSRDQLAAAQTLARLGSWENDLLKGEVRWSDELFRIFGFEPGDCQPSVETFIERVHPDDREEMLKRLDDRPPGPFQFELRIVRTDGSIRVLQENGRVEVDHSGRPVRSIGTALDITDRKDKEELIERLHLRSQLILDSTSDGICGLDREGRATFVNAAAAGMLGWRPKELVGKYLHNLIHHTRADGSPYPAEECRTLPALQGQPVVGVEDEVFWRRDGSSFPVEYSATPIIEDEEVTGAVLTFRDMGERGMILAEKYALEGRVQQVERLESVGRLAGGIAHDFNNLLAVILNYAAFVAEEVPEGRLREDIGQIRSAAERASRLTRQLLIFSRRDPARPELLDLNAVVADIDRLLQPTIGEDVELELSLDRTVPAVLVDRGQFEQVLVNLVVNARDAMPEGGRLCIETAIADVDARDAGLPPGLFPGRYLRLTVTDDGEGMPEEVAARAFEPFFTTKQQGRGTGLGLATVYGIVAQAGGWVDIDSSIGQGTTVTVTLPAAEGIAESDRPADEAEPHGGGETVLVVEDEHGVREATIRILERAGYTVLQAAKADDALDIHSRHGGRIELLLTDVVMPGMSGPKLAERIRAADDCVRVLFVSGYTEDLTERSGEAAGAGQLLRKPFDSQALLTAVREALDGWPDAAAP